MSAAHIDATSRLGQIAGRRSRFLVGVAAAVGAAFCCSCKSFGPRQVPIDRFDYNTAIATSANEQMLLNLVRLRFGEVPTFLAVNSVLTQYVWAGDVGVSGASGDSLGFPAWTVGGSANARYFERPTVTYSPLSGQEFASQLLSPVRADVVFSLVSSGWPPDQLLAMSIQRINGVANVSLAALAGSGRSEHAQFDQVIELFVDLARRNAIELVRGVAADQDVNYLEFTKTPDAECAERIRELKSILSLDPARSRFRVTRKILDREPDEITIRMHSLLELMGILSAGVTPPINGASATEPIGPLLVRSGTQRPVDAFVAVFYGDHWYYIDRSDEAGKRAFGLLIYLFQMQASQNQGPGPLLTVPVG